MREHGKDGRERRDGSGRAEEAAMTTRRWFEFVSTRYRSSGSICPRPSFCVSPSPSPTCFLSLRRARYLDSPASFSVALCRSRFFFVPRFVPDTRRADPLHYPLPSLYPVRLVLSRQPHRFTFYVPPAVSLALSLSIYLSTFLWCTRAPRINPSPFRAPYLLSRTGSLVLPLALDAALLSLFLSP